MATKNQTPEEEFADRQDKLASLPNTVSLSASLIEIVADANVAPESLLGSRVRYVRNDLMLSVEALSRLTKEYDLAGGGLSPTSISRYESGEALPGLREFRLIAESLAVPVGWLLYGTMEEKKPEFTSEDRSLLYALRTFVASARDDSKIENPIDTSWHKEQDRMAKMNRARKPPPKEKPAVK